MSGFGFLFHVDRLGWTPDAYMVNGKPGTGLTDFETVAHFVFALVYLVPIAGVLHAHYEGTASARRSACVAPLLYHTASVYGCVTAFGPALNPAVATIPVAASMHAVYGVLFALLYWLAHDDLDDSKQKVKAK